MFCTVRDGYISSCGEDRFGRWVLAGAAYRVCPGLIADLLLMSTSTEGRLFSGHLGRVENESVPKAWCAAVTVVTCACLSTFVIGLAVCV